VSYLEMACLTTCFEVGKRRRSGERYHGSYLISNLKPILSLEMQVTEVLKKHAPCRAKTSTVRAIHAVVQRNLTKMNSPGTALVAPVCWHSVEVIVVERHVTAIGPQRCSCFPAELV
jgi:hypothetical protein